MGKTSLIYHLGWMFSQLGKCVVITDIDPQANLTASFLDEDQIDDLWSKAKPGSTIYQCVKPFTEFGDISPPLLHKITDDLYLLPGDMALSGYEDTLSGEWPGSMNDKNLYRPMRILTSFWQIMQMAANKAQADMILVDIGPNLGAINRSVLLSTDYVAIPLAADLFSLQGLYNLGPTLDEWRDLWKKRLNNWKESKEHYPDFQLPAGNMKPIGYLCQQYGVRLDRPVQAYDKWVQRIPTAYRKEVLREDKPPGDIKQEEDPYCLATIKHYRSLIPMAQEHRKPIFKLTAADGAIGSHANAVKKAGEDFETLAREIAKKIGTPVMM